MAGTLSEQAKAIAFAVASAVFFLGYFLSGVRKWGWLFPALICAALALTMWMSTTYIVPSFMVVHHTQRCPAVLCRLRPGSQALGSVNPGIAVTGATIFMLVVDPVQGEWANSIIMVLFALPFFVTYFWSKKNWWAFIPAGVFAGLAG